jgi:arylsulfatase A-like enzyme
MDNTIIIYTSDHGCHFKTRNREYKRSCHESSIRIPLIISGEGFQGGKDINELVSLIDLPPTILSCANIEVPDYMQGRSLRNLLQNTNKNWSNEIFIQISETQVGRAIRTKKWKLSVRAPKKHGFLYANSEIYKEDLLFDLENDPHEQNNLIDDERYDNVKKVLTEKLIEYINCVEDMNSQIIPYNA